MQVCLHQHVAIKCVWRNDLGGWLVTQLVMQQRAVAAIHYLLNGEKGTESHKGPGKGLSYEGTRTESAKGAEKAGAPSACVVAHAGVHCGCMSRKSRNRKIKKSKNQKIKNYLRDSVEALYSRHVDLLGAVVAWIHAVKHVSQGCVLAGVHAVPFLGAGQSM